MSESLDGKAVVIIGGSSGIGLATARAAQRQGAGVTIVGRDKDRLAAALDELGGGASGDTFDVADEAAVKAFFATHEGIDPVVNLAGTHVNGAIADLDTDAMRVPVDNRFFGPVHVFKYAPPAMNAGGSITICTGVGVARPRPGGAIVSAACIASELLAQAMAVELAPLRVNVIRPGIVDTPLLDRMTGGHKDEVLAGYAKRVPLRRVAQPEDIADGILFLLTNTYVTGSILTVDGGVGLI